ncbi:AAA family ATPase [Paracoccus salsus]|uniref:AAA family ATPase n=1 Tax=Paracoccus salsus TaxID=2911061 RepID=UPI001F3825D0|nr:AAA family ATPase [Paracoccus salsus]MCF3972580.1 AAA family ATPase [Paracoccus salsus]
MMNATEREGPSRVSPGSRHEPGAGRLDDAAQGALADRAGPSEDGGQPLGRIPYITLRAFCETPEFIATLKQAAGDRRLSRAEFDASPGGLRGAVQFFATQPTPDLLVIEADAQSDDFFQELETLAEVCDAKTRVVVVGSVNDVLLYRRLVERGITEYLVAPVDPSRLISVFVNLFPQHEAAQFGKVVAFIGGKGGAGSSTVAQNTAWALARNRTKVLLADLDLQFGTAALNYNINAPIGFADQLDGADRLDDASFERLLHKPAPNLSVLAGATASRSVVAPSLEALDRLLDRARSTFPLVLLDLPHEWSPWVRQALLSVDEVIVTAEPDLANLRNARMLFDLLKEARPNDVEPVLVLNKVRVPRREEIRPVDFAAALGVPLDVQVGYAPRLFSKSANGGQMLAELSAAAGRPFLQIAQSLGGTAPARPARSFLKWRSAR